MVQTIEILRDQSENKRFKKILDGVSRTLTAGSRLSEAMAAYPKVFPREYVSIVVSGESGGDLVKALSSITQWMERELEIRTAIKSDLRYPIMVCIALVLAAIIMLTFVIPKFSMFFTKSAVGLPLPTRVPSLDQPGALGVIATRQVQGSTRSLRIRRNLGKSFQAVVYHAFAIVFLLLTCPVKYVIFLRK
ncbi:MAG: type II secretion system F family protein [Kiritimatiellae bacterium]|nr:type II secretion system F family protein [Kiritimatiellia bacterium]